MIFGIEKNIWFGWESSKMSDFCVICIQSSSFAKKLSYQQTKNNYLQLINIQVLVDQAHW